MSEQVTTQVETSSAPVNTERGVETYEDALLVINAVKDEQSVANLHAALMKLKGFFDRRVGKKKSEVERNSGSAVKKAIESRRTYTRYETKPTPNVTAPKSPFGP